MCVGINQVQPDKDADDLTAGIACTKVLPQIQDQKEMESLQEPRLLD